MGKDHRVVLFLSGILLVLPFTVLAYRSPSVNVQVIFPDRTIRFRTQADFVGKVLTTEGINVSKYKRTFPSLNSRVVDGLKIFLYNQAPPYGTRSSPPELSNSLHRTVYTPFLPYGRELIVRGNAPSQSKSDDGFESSRVKIAFRGRSLDKAERIKELVERKPLPMLATGYSTHSNSTAPFDDGVSALGIPAGYGLVAVDPDVIPLGTRLYVEGYGYAIAADVGGEIDGRRIDLCFENPRDAIQFGREWVKVHVLG